MTGLKLFVQFTKYRPINSDGEGGGGARVTHTHTRIFKVRLPEIDFPAFWPW